MEPLCVIFLTVDLESAMFRVQLSRRIHTREATEDELTEDAVVADVTYVVDATDYKAAEEAYKHLVESGIVSTGTVSDSSASTRASAASSKSSVEGPGSRMVATSRVKLSHQPGFRTDVDLDPYGRRVEVQHRGEGKRPIRRIVTTSGKKSC